MKPLDLKSLQYLISESHTVKCILRILSNRALSEHFKIFPRFPMQGLVKEHST